MKIILGLDPGLSHTAAVSIRATPGEPPVLLDRLLWRKEDQHAGGNLDTNTLIWYAVRQFALLQEPSLIAIESFQWRGNDDDRSSPKTRCPRCGHIYSMPQSSLAPEVEDMLQLVGALRTLNEIAPIVEYRPAQWRIELTGHPMPKKKRLDGVTVRTGYEHQVRKRVYEVLRLNAGELLTVDEVDAAGIALVAALELRANPCDKEQQNRYGSTMKKNCHCQH